jgi:hypothetical protein
MKETNMIKKAMYDLVNNKAGRRKFKNLGKCARCYTVLQITY